MSTKDQIGFARYAEQQIRETKHFIITYCATEDHNVKTALAKLREAELLLFAHHMLASDTNKHGTQKGKNYGS